MFAFPVASLPCWTVQRHSEESYAMGPSGLLLSLVASCRVPSPDTS